MENSGARRAVQLPPCRFRKSSSETFKQSSFHAPHIFYPDAETAAQRRISHCILVPPVEQILHLRDGRKPFGHWHCRRHIPAHVARIAGDAVTGADAAEGVALEIAVRAPPHII